MKHLYPKNILLQLLALAVIITFAQPASAQCPSGSVSATNGATYGSGVVVCVSGNFTGSITLNSGSKLVVANAGNYTGDINANAGSTIEVYKGGIFNPNNANNFAAAVDVKKGATTILGTGNISTTTGFSLISQGSVTWAKSWTQNQAQTVTNGSCGTMIFKQNGSLQNNSTIVNNGIMEIQGTLTTNSGTSIDNRGSFKVTGTVTLSGYFKNQWKAIFAGASTNTFNTGDSVINLYAMTFSSGITNTPKFRNEGLLWIRGAVSFNSGGGVVMNASNAMFRVDGAISNGGIITGKGNSMYVGGAYANGGTTQGFNSSNKLKVNTSPSGGTATNLMIASFTPVDTASFTGGNGNSAVCTALLPMKVTALKGSYRDDAILLSWATLTEANGKKFIVEYSTDGVAFTTAGEVAAKGNSNARIEYSFLFTKINSPSLYFRLQLVDIDGAVEYTNTVLVKTFANN
jgi:hypothetical protein